MSSQLSAQFGGDAVNKSVPVTDAYTQVLSPIDVQNYPHFAIYAENSAGDDITSITLETAPEASGPWFQLGDAVDGSLATGESTFLNLSNKAAKFIRSRAKCGAGDSATLNIWLCATRYGR